ncbi:hypothetical protein HMN09_00123100 [Mycena chlorophos]|uniref:Thioesterase family protein n=1 Tax=Mycena chlorophos TaxID=658473 RepID=A0A8H6TV85_MYCCL|nr:hypothetical protein HMN09_00123100 [Mycena chlorophos]
MPPLSEVLLNVARKSGSEAVYTGRVGKDWTVGRIPHGGTVLGIVLQAAIVHQANLEHPTPLHVTVHYLQPTKTLTELEVELKVLKRGKNFVNLIADLVQEGTVRLTAHLIFAKPVLNYPRFSPSSGYARRIPLSHHPAQSVATDPAAVFSGFRFSEHVQWAQDPVLLADATRTRPNGVAIWGAWIELRESEERITPASLAFFADCFANLSSMWPADVTNGGSGWTPTLTLSLEYKHPVPPASDTRYATRTLGVYAVSGHLGAPQNRHNTFVEIWTAPSVIGSRTPIRDNWEEDQVCLAVASQMQLLMNGKEAKRNDIHPRDPTVAKL